MKGAGKNRGLTPLSMSLFLGHSTLNAQLRGRNPWSKKFFGESLDTSLKYVILFIDEQAPTCLLYHCTRPQSWRTVAPSVVCTPVDFYSDALRATPETERVQFAFNLPFYGVDSCSATSEIGSPEEPRKKIVSVHFQFPPASVPSVASCSKPCGKP